MNIPICNRLFEENEIASKEEHFPSYVNQYLLDYCEFLESVKCDASIIEKVALFKQNIALALYSYNAGFHVDAYDSMMCAIKALPLHRIIHKLEDGVYYRARKPEKDKLLFSSEEMFHIPFEARYKVRTQRYSYPGYPCLYISGSLTACCDEITGDEELNIAFYRYEASNDDSTKEINIVDLCFFDHYNFEQLTQPEYETFLLLWPLVACCSFTFRERDEMSFRPDYIVPQMLLEYVIAKSIDSLISEKDIEIPKNVYGIRYAAVKMLPDCLAGKKSYSDCINYVFPAVEIQDRGHCPTLKKLFRVEQVQMLKDIR